MSAFRPICQLCKRPFNPRSPGATSDFGPTCAKKALSFADSESSQMIFESSRDMATKVSKSEVLRTTVRPVVLSQQTQDLFEPAKVAFEEIYRRYLKQERVCYGDEAKNRYQDLLTQSHIEVYSLEDSQLNWLQAEDNVSLIRSIETEEFFYFRKFNGSYTLLDLSSEESPLFKDLISQITKYTYHQKLQRKQQSEYQLSLFEQD